MKDFRRITKKISFCWKFKFFKRMHSGCKLNQEFSMNFDLFVFLSKTHRKLQQLVNRWYIVILWEISGKFLKISQNFIPTFLVGNWVFSCNVYTTRASWDKTNDLNDTFKIMLLINEEQSFSKKKNEERSYMHDRGVKWYFGNHSTYLLRIDNLKEK